MSDLLTLYRLTLVTPEGWLRIRHLGFCGEIIRLNVICLAEYQCVRERLFSRLRFPASPLFMGLHYVNEQILHFNVSFISLIVFYVLTF